MFMLKYVAAATLVAAFGVTAPAQVPRQATDADSSRSLALGPSRRLSLLDVYRELRARSPRLAAADALARAARARVPSAGLPPDPQVQLGWMNYSLPALAPMAPLGMVQFQVMQMLPLGGKLRLSRGIAGAQASAQEQRAQDAWWDARSQAAMVFYELYQADRQLAVMRETLRLLADIRKTSESMYRVGEGRQADVLRAQVAIARMSADTIRMRTMRTAAAARLDALLDRLLENGPTLWEPAVLPRFPSEVPSLDSLEQVALANRPMLRAGADEVDAATQMTRLARKELLPDLQLGVQYGQRGATMTSPSVTGEPMADRTTERMGSLMIGASVPIFARSRQLEQRREAAAMRQMAAAELAAMRAETRGGIGKAYAELTRARNLAALYRTTILPQSEAAVSSAFSAYRAGQVDFMTLLENQMTVNEYRQALAALEAEEGTAWAELEMLTGRELVDSTRSAPVAAPGGAR